MLLAALALAFAQDALPTLSGRALAPDGSPARGQAFLVDAYPPRGWEPDVVSIALDEDGGFTLSPSRSWMARTSNKSLTLGVLAEGSWLALSYVVARDLPVGQDLLVQLETGAPGELRIIGPDGAPVAGARVSVAQLENDDVRSIVVADKLHAGVLRDASAVTDENGIARITHWNPAGTRAVRVQAAGFGVQTYEVGYSNNAPLTGDVQLAAPATVRVRWVGDGDPPPFDVEFFGFVQLGEDVDQDPRISSKARGHIDATTRAFEVELAGLVTPTLRSDDPRVLGLTFDSEKENGVQTIDVRSTETRRVRVRIVEEKSREPIPGVEVNVGSYRSETILTSGDDGVLAFDAHPLPGSLRVIGVPAGVREGDIYSSGWSVPTTDAGVAFDLGDVTLARSAPAYTGRVVDEEGAGVAGAWVAALFKIEGARWSTDGAVFAVTDEFGRYRLEGTPEGTLVELEARFGGLRTLAPSVATTEPALLTLSALAAPAGRVVDQDGQPIEGAELAFWTRSPENMIGGERRVSFGAGDAVRSGPDGVIQGVPGLEPDEDYCVVVNAPGCSELRTSYQSCAELAAGVEFALARGATFAGVLKDESGAPLAGVPLRLRSGGTAVVTGADGSFSLPGVGPHGDIALVELEDGTVYAQDASADEQAEWVLRGPSVERPLEREEAAPRDVELGHAAELLHARYEDALKGDREHEVLRSLQALAWADPAFVLDAVEKGAVKSSWEGMVLAQAVYALRAESPDEALAVAERMDGAYGSAMSVMNVIDTLPASARPEKLEHLALARAKARQIQGPAQQLIIFSWVAQRLLALGEEDSARAVFEEGRAIAANLPTDEWSGFARASFAEDLAVIDLDAALELVDELASADDRSRHWGNIAHKLAARDPAACQRVLLKLNASRGSWQPERYAARIAYAMAPVDLERARKLAGRFDESGFSDGMIALSLCELDPGEARASLATAFERVRQAEDHWMYPPIRVGAALLDVVERLEPETLEARLWQVLALRPPVPYGGSLNGDEPRWRAEGDIAFYAARWDRALARKLLEPAVESARGRDPRALGREWRSVWAAVALTDPEWAAAVGHELGGDARATIGKVLAVPPAERRDYVQDEYMNLWIVGKEDI